jgi:hypothetical protein
MAIGAASGADAYIAVAQSGYQRGVVVQYFELPIKAREAHRSGLALKHPLIGSYYFQMHKLRLLFSVSHHFLAFGYCVFNAAYQVKGRFGQVVVQAIHNTVKTFNGIFNIHQNAF